MGSKNHKYNSSYSHLKVSLDEVLTAQQGYGSLVCKAPYQLEENSQEELSNNSVRMV